MTFIAHLVYLVAQSLHFVASQLNRLANAFDGLLPALLSPAQLNALTRKLYRGCYSQENIQANTAFDQHDLQTWEQKVVSRYAITSGRILIMGSGLGREALAMARLGLSVIGVDTNDAALRTAQRLALAANVPARFHQADYLALPYAAGSFDYALLSATMYSAIPGLAQRQAWLNDVGRLLKPDGLAIISFNCDFPPPQSFRLRALYRRLKRLLSKLPGANPAYQTGDSFPGGHFMHIFQDEQELRDELKGVGVTVRELNWPQGFAVISYPHPRERPIAS